MIKIFKKNDFNQGSDNYYHAYKADLEKKEVKSKFFSLNNIIKAEFFTLVAGLVFMSYNNFFDHFSIEFKSNIFTSSSSSIVVPQHNNFEREENIFMAQLQNSEVDNIEAIEIKEESTDKTLVEEQVAILSKKLHINATDMTLLVEIIKSQMNQPSRAVQEDKIIISQL